MTDLDLIQLLAPNEVVGSIGQEGMVLVFGTQNGVGNGHAPVNVETLIQKRDACVRLGGIIVVAFVLKHRFFGENGKTVCKTAGDEELEMVVFAQFHGNVLPKGGTALTNVYGYIEDATAGAAHKFTLRVGHSLIVKTAHHTARGARFVVLHKINGTHEAVELLLGKGFKEIAAIVAKQSGFEDDYVGNGRGMYYHCRKELCF